VSRWPTPRRLRAFLGVILAGSLLLLLVGETSLARARATYKTIGQDSAPSIIAAEEMSADFANIDANAANYLLGSAVDADVATQLFEFRRAAATKRLVDAAQNITYGDAERVPVIIMFENLGRYLEAVAQARYRHDRGDVAGALDMYRVATDLMHHRILPAAAALDTANADVMARMYDAHAKSGLGSWMLAVTVGVLLVVALLWAQLFLFMRTRRLFNPALVAATALAVAFTGYLLTRFETANYDLKVARMDAFVSIRALWQIRATAFDAAGDASRYLLDRERASYFENAFRANVAKLTNRTPATNHVSDVGSGTGLFADEWNNVTFPGELAAATGMIDGFARYYVVDDAMRRVEKGGRHADAVELCIGSKVGDAGPAFDAFDEFAQRAIRINEAVFDQLMQEGDRGLRRAEILDPGFAVSIALLGFVGVRRRLREYQG
jgi:hypothetical protein